MDLDALLLSRLQFAFTIAFHIIFPSFTIGLASYLAVLEGLWLATGREAFKVLYLFWIKIFAISFGMGVVSGVVHVLPARHQLERLFRRAAPVIGPLLAFEVLAAFFLEASFLGVMLFGWKKVGPRLHFAAPPCWWRSARWSRPSGSSRPTAGCSTRPACPARRTARCAPTSWMQVIFSPTFPVAPRRTWCWRPT